MKNRWEKRDGYIVIFANGSGLLHEILVDEADFETVAAFLGTWGACKDRNTLYAQIKVRGANGKRTTAQMHRLLLNPPAELQVDHKNHNGLDNRRENIRIVTNGENARNRIDNVEFQSDVDGVTWLTRDKAWRAQPTVNSKQIRLNCFDEKREAEAAVCMFLETGMRVKHTDLRRTAEFQSDVDGVIWDARIKAWRAQPRVNGKKEYLGLYDTRPEAEAAVCMFRETGMRVKRSRKNCVGRKDDPPCTPSASVAFAR